MTSPILKTLTLLIIMINLHSLTQSQPFQDSLAPSPLASPLEPGAKSTPQYIKFLKACEKRLTLECSEQVVEHVIHDGKFPKSCCSKLIGMGPDCHAALVNGENRLLKAYGKGEKKRITVSGDKLWNKCEKSVPPPKDKNYPRLPIIKFRPDYYTFLEGCMGKMTDKCAKEIVDSIFVKGKEVDKSCCKRLVNNMGKECHDMLVEALASLGKYEKKGKDVKQNSERVWKHCEEIVKD